MERTLGIIKPDAVAAGNMGGILSAIEGAGLTVIAMRMEHLSKHQAEGFYAVHRGRPFYDGLTDFMSSGRCVAMVLEGENAIARWRGLMGPTDSTKAPKDSLRGRFGTTLSFNAVHGSDAPDTAATEISFFFPGISLTLR